MFQCAMISRGHRGISFAWFSLLACFWVCGLLPAGPAAAGTLTAVSPLEGGRKVKLQADFGKLPLYFVENGGQMDPRVDYYVKGRDKTLYFTAEGMTVVMTQPAEGGSRPRRGIRRAAYVPQTPEPTEGRLQRWAVRLRFVGANPGVKPVGIEEMYLDQSVDRIAAGDVLAQVSYPSVDVSLKDGFAVISADIAAASKENRVLLKITGSAFAGYNFKGEVKPGTAVKICSGAPIPAGADAVVSAEFCEELSANEVSVKADAESGRNILRAGGEVNKAGAEQIEATSDSAQYEVAKTGYNRAVSTQRNQCITGQRVDF